MLELHPSHRTHRPFRRTPGLRPTTIWGQYSEGPATGHLDTGFSWFPCVYKQMLTDGSQHSKLLQHASHVALPT